MRIVSCHIENFGKLHDYSISFSAGLNRINAENGWGKSTLAAFIRAMFYGLDGERKKSIEENERKRYMPWQGGIFGGQLVFELGGEQYRISRIFHEKEGRDEFEVREIKTNIISGKFSNKIGEEIFKINRESFLKTVFIRQSDCETSTTDDINAKLVNLTESDSDLNCFEEACARLTELLNGMNPGRATGSLSKRREEIARLDKIIQDGKDILGKIEDCQNHLHNEKENYGLLKKKRQEIGEQQEKLLRIQEILAKKSEWERLKHDISVKQKEVEHCRRSMPGEIPELETVKRMILECGRMDKAGEKMALYRLSATEEAEVAELAEIFATGIPAEDDINRMLEEADRFRKLSQEYGAEQLNFSERVRLGELEVYFQEETGEAAFMTDMWNNRCSRQAALPSRQAALAVLRQSVAGLQTRKRSRGIYLLLGSIFAVSGGIAVALDFYLPGSVLFLAGVVCLTLGIGKKRNSKSLEQPTALMELEQEVEADIAFIQRAEEETARYINAHGKTFDKETAGTTLQEIMTEFMEYTSLKKKDQKARESIKVLRLEQLRQVLCGFLDKYGIMCEDLRFYEDLYILKDKAVRYLAWKEKQEKFRLAAEEYAAVKMEIYRFLKEHGYIPGEDLLVQLLSIRELAETYQNNIRLLAAAQEARKQFEEQTEVAVLENAETESEFGSPEACNQKLLQVSEEMEKVHSRILHYHTILEELQQKYEDWEECRRKLEELKKVQEEEQKKYTCLFAARSKLESAKEALTARYADPVRNVFCAYMEQLSGIVSERFFLDAKATVTLEELGRQRGVNTLSTGYRDLIGFCLRMAFVEVMYREEIPFLVMDDPFTNLDDKKIREGKALLEKLGEKYQIIYMTCSSVRD